MPKLNKRQILDLIRPRFVEEWKGKYCLWDEREPTDAEMDFPPQTLTARWDTGYIVIDVDGLAELPVRKQNKILRLGGFK